MGPGAGGLGGGGGFSVTSGHPFVKGRWFQHLFAPKMASKCEGCGRVPLPRAVSHPMEPISGISQMVDFSHFVSYTKCPVLVRQESRQLHLQRTTYMNSVSLCRQRLILAQKWLNRTDGLMPRTAPGRFNEHTTFAFTVKHFRPQTSRFFSAISRGGRMAPAQTLCVTMYGIGSVFHNSLPHREMHDGTSTCSDGIHIGKPARFSSQDQPPHEEARQKVHPRRPHWAAPGGPPHCLPVSRP